MKYEIGDAVKVFRDFEGNKRNPPEPGTIINLLGERYTVRLTEYSQTVTTVGEIDLMPDYPELTKVAKRIANETLAVINQNVQGVESKMLYKGQYVLEEIIKILEEAV